MGILGGVAAIPYLYRRVDEEIRCRLEQRFAQHYHGLKVSIGSAELVEHEGITIRDLTIVEPLAEGPRAELLRIEEMRLRCDTDVQKLLCSEPVVVTHVTMRRPVLQITRRRDGTWSAAKLFPPPRFADRAPQLTIENGVIEIFDPQRIPCSTLTLRELHLTLGAPTSTPDPNGAANETRALTGTLACDHFRRAEFHGTLVGRGTAFSLSGNIQGLEISPELCRALPDPLAAKLTALGRLRGESQMSFRTAYDPAEDVPLSFHVAGQLDRGRIDDPRLPHPLSDIRLTFQADNGGLTLKNLTARMNKATLRLSCRQAGFDDHSPLSLQAEIRQLELDRQLLGALPAVLQNQWYKYRPIGRIDADVQLEFDGQTWRPEISLRSRNVSFTHYKFPYRVDHGKGTLELKNNRLTLNATAQSGNQPIRMTAEVQHPLDGPAGWFGWFEARGQAIPLNQSLINALPPKPRQVAHDLDPRGTVDFYYRSWRDAPRQPLHRHLVLNANGCSIRYRNFPYPLNNVRGQLEMFDHQWTFRNLEGANDTARVTGEGYLKPTLQGNQLVLQLVGKDVPLEEELRNALKPHIQKIWHNLRPRGVVDLTADVLYHPGQKQLSVGVRAQPQSETASIEPVHFPYRMEKLQGTLLYRDGHVTLEHLKAEHGPVKIATEGYCDFHPDGRWKMRFAGLTVDRLLLDRDLIQALPERLKKAVLTLEPSGPLNLRGNFDLIHSGKQGEPLQSAWDVQIGMMQGRLLAGVLLENVHGVVTLRGGFDGHHVQSRGELDVDSLSYQDYQFTQVQGPLWIDDDRVLLGTWVDEPNQRNPPPPATPPQTPRPLSARLFGGTLSGDGWVALGREPYYAFGATLAHASLARCAQEVIHGKQNLQGDMMATVELRGAGAGRHALFGRGSVRLSNADVYELPVMIALLKILSIRPPDLNAFSNSSIDYRIEGEHIYFDRIDFNGDAISLLGKGEMDWQSNINLNFRAVVGRGDVQIPLLKEVFTGASRGIMTVHVDGTLQNPQTRKEAFPAVNQALQELQNRRRE